MSATPSAWSAPAVPALEARFKLGAGEGEGAFEVEASLALERGTLVLFGPSGAGKTLTLEGLAGLVRPREGHVRFGGKAFFDAGAGVWVPPHARGVGYVPQRASLFPFTDVLGNVGFALPAPDRRAGTTAMRLLSQLGMAHRARARPQSLSGGERQRVALARALSTEPRLLLLDEPFASIDLSGKRSLYAELRASFASRGLLVVLVTHDPLEALEMGDVLVPIDAGRTGAPTTPAEFFKDARHLSTA